MKHLIIVGFLILIAIVAASPAEACTSTQSCIQAVHDEAAAQTRGVSQGPKWRLSRQGCQKAGREQEANEKRCRSYDLQDGGKTLEQCAKCLRQAIFDAARWAQCHAKGWAPAVPGAIHESIARLGQQLQALR